MHNLFFDVALLYSRDKNTSHKLKKGACVASINKFIGIGRLGKQPEPKQLPNGSMVCNFSIACSEKYKDKSSGQYVEKTEWINIVAFGKLAEICDKYLSKGSQVYVEGKLQTRSWDDKDGNKKYMTEINAKEVLFVGGKGEQQGGAEPSKDYKVSTDASFASSDIPF